MTWGGHQRASGCHEEPRERQRMTFHLLERPQCFKINSWGDEVGQNDQTLTTVVGSNFKAAKNDIYIYR